MNVRGALNEATARLPRSDAALLLAAALGASRLEVATSPDRPLSDAEAARFRAYVTRRAQGEPASRILGRREFWSLDLEIGPAVLDPRPDTETVVEAALAAAGDRSRPLDVLDFGTGSGCILLALLSELPCARGLGVDRSLAAIDVARRNADRLGLRARARFLAADWGEPLVGRFDLIVSNPPYVRRDDIAGLAREVAQHDPAIALDGGPDGLDAYRRLARDLPRLLASGGIAALEIGHGQADDVAALLQGRGLAIREIRADLSGVPRCVVAERGEKTVGMSEPPR